MTTTKSADDPQRSGGGDVIAVETVDTHMLFVERVGEMIEMEWKAIRGERDHEGNSFNRIILINPDTLDVWWNWRKIQPWTWKFVNAVIEHVGNNVMW
jgi:hypothetical protein